MPTKKRSQRSERWIAAVTTDSTHPPKGLFTKSASTIAGVEKAVAQGSRIRNAYAYLLHQPRRA